MHIAENALQEMLRRMEASLPELGPDAPPRQAYFVLYYRHLLRLLDGALLLSRQTLDSFSPRILLRSALECKVDLKNLAENKDYYLVLQAMELDERVCVFRYKSAHAYQALLKRVGKKKANVLEKRFKASLKQKLREATDRFPILQNAAGRLTVLTRFRIAGEEELYQTRYTALSLSTHNNASLLELDQNLELDLPMDLLEDEQIVNTAMEFAVDAIKYRCALFGLDEGLVRGCIELLLELKQQKKQAVPE